MSFLNRGLPLPVFAHRDSLFLPRLIMVQASCVTGISCHGLPAPESFSSKSIAWRESVERNLVKALIRQPLYRGRRKHAKAFISEPGGSNSEKSSLRELLQVGGRNLSESSSSRIRRLGRLPFQGRCNASLTMEKPKLNDIMHVHEAQALRLGLELDSPNLPSVQYVLNEVLKQAANHDGNVKGIHNKPGNLPISTKGLLNEAYKRCGEMCAEFAKTFYLGTTLMTPQRKKAVWAVYVWCRRTDELVDGPNASYITATALDRWESRLEDIFNGKPYDMLDAALADTVSTFAIDIQSFRDMIKGMRMDLVKPRYKNFHELYLYCYYVAGTVGLMSVPVMGISPESKAKTEAVYQAAVDLGVANQLTNILRDVGEDSRRGRIYLPRDEIMEFGLSEQDIFSRTVTEKWRAFMRFQMNRARHFFDEAEKGVAELDRDSRWPVWASLMLYRQILDSIEKNDYNNFSQRAYVGRWKKLRSLPLAFARSVLPPSSSAVTNARYAGKRRVTLLRGP